jgi:ectoine hydroxylase-related dioxygenase (phytanoyl-CoA dioxygenase family)
MNTILTAASFTVLDLSSNQAVQASADDLRARFDRDGVLIFPGFLSEAEMAPLRREMEKHYAPRAATAATTHNGAGKYAKFECDVLVWGPIAENNAEFLALQANARLNDVTTIVVGEDYTKSASGLVMFSVGGGRGQAWHQDCPSPEPGAPESRAFNLNRLFYTDNVTLDDGAIVFVPGSHRMGRIPPGGHQDPIAGERALEPTAGTLVLLHGHVYHRVTPNLNMKPRTSINLRAYPKGTPTTVTCIGIYRNGSVNFCESNKQHDGQPAVMADK